jgi:dolichyl-phosphate beta-glucosyltransferase
MNNDKKSISIIIPAFNEAELIEDTLFKTVKYSEVNCPDAEILVINDGSRDNTQVIVNDFIKAFTGGVKIHLVNNDKNRGKGFSIRHGVEVATSDIIIFFDADLPYDLSGIGNIVSTIDQGFDIVLGSRVTSSSIINVKIPFRRRIASAFYRSLVHLLFAIESEDTQCGFKGFTQNAAKNIFPKTRIEGFGFDIEVLALAKKYGYRVKSIPVIFNNQRENSKINLIVDSLKMIRDMIRVKIYISRME